MKRVVIIGAGESGIGAAILAKKHGFDVFVSDFGTISPEQKAELNQIGVAFEEKQHTEELREINILSQSMCQYQMKQEIILRESV